MWTRRSFLAAYPAQQIFRVTSRAVVVPVTVLDSRKRRVAGLEKSDFRLSDAGLERDFTLEEMNSPVSVLVAVETALTSAAALEKLRKSKGVFEPLIAGDGGELGLLCYDSDIRLEAAIDADTTRFDSAMAALAPRGASGRLHDAVVEAARLFEQRPSQRRRILFVIGESKDLGSQAKLDRAVEAAQSANIVIYPITYSRTTTAFTTRTPPATAAAGPDILGALRELSRLGKANGAAELARHTGGVSTSFTSQRGLEAALQRASEEIHQQYLLTFEARDATPGQYRSLAVSLPHHPTWTVRHRPGYWLPADA